MIPLVEAVEFTPELPEGENVTCPGLSKKIGVSGCANRQTVLNNACKVQEDGGASTAFDVRFQ
jgi:hypothetical protein